MQRRKRNARWLTLDQASLIARQAGCTSCLSYERWHNATRPNNIPKKPQRVYKNWQGWAAFLGTCNIFGKEEKSGYRPYWEAVKWAQKVCIENNLTRMIDWFHYYDENENTIPKDIPRNAHYHYKEDWIGWPTWTGANIEARIIVAREKVGVFALCTMPWAPKNVIRIVVANDGIEDLREKCIDENLTVLKAYKFEPELAEEMQSVMHAMGTQQTDGTFIIRDINMLLFEFNNMLLEVKLQFLL